MTRRVEDNEDGRGRRRQLQSLVEFCMEGETNCSSRGDEAPSEWLRMTLQNVSMDEVEEFLELLARIRRSLNQLSSNPDASEEEVKDDVDSIRTSADLVLKRMMNASFGVYFDKLSFSILGRLLKSSFPSLQMKGTDVIEGLLGFNKDFSRTALDFGILDLVVKLLDSEFEPVKVKAVSVISCLIGANPRTLDAFNKLNGFSTLVKVLQETPKIARVLKKCGTCIRPLWAEAYCDDCFCPLCKICVVEHRALFATKNHKVSPSENIYYDVPQSDVCGRHAEHKVEKHCETCALALCQLCLTEDERHSSHTLTDLDLVRNQSEADLAVILEKLKTFSNDWIVMREKLRSTYKTYETTSKELSTELKSIFAEVYELLLQRAHDLNEDIVAAVTMKSMRVNVQLSILRSLVSQSQTVVQITDVLKSFSSPSTSKLSRKQIAFVYKFVGLFKKQVRYIQAKKLEIDNEADLTFRIEDPTEMLKAMKSVIRIVAENGSVSTSPTDTTPGHSAQARIGDGVADSTAGNQRDFDESGRTRPSEATESRSQEDVDADLCGKSAFFIEDESSDEEAVSNTYKRVRIKPEPREMNSDDDEALEDGDDHFYNPLYPLKREIDSDVEMDISCSGNGQLVERNNDPVLLNASIKLESPDAECDIPQPILATERLRIKSEPDLASQGQNEVGGRGRRRKTGSSQQLLENQFNSPILSPPPSSCPTETDEVGGHLQQNGNGITNQYLDPETGIVNPHSDEIEAIGAPEVIVRSLNDGEHLEIHIENEEGDHLQTTLVQGEPTQQSAARFEESFINSSSAVATDLDTEGNVNSDALFVSNQPQTDALRRNLTRSSAWSPRNKVPSTPTWVTLLPEQNKPNILRRRSPKEKSDHINEHPGISHVTTYQNLTFLGSRTLPTLSQNSSPPKLVLVGGEDAQTPTTQRGQEKNKKTKPDRQTGKKLPSKKQASAKNSKNKNTNNDPGPGDESPKTNNKKAPRGNRKSRKRNRPQGSVGGTDNHVPVPDVSFKPSYKKWQFTGEPRNAELDKTTRKDGGAQVCTSNPGQMNDHPTDTLTSGVERRASPRRKKAEGQATSTSSNVVELKSASKGAANVDSPASKRKDKDRHNTSVRASLASPKPLEASSANLGLSSGKQPSAGSPPSPLPPLENATQAPVLNKSPATTPQANADKRKSISNSVDEVGTELEGGSKTPSSTNKSTSKERVVCATDTTTSVVATNGLSSETYQQNISALVAKRNQPELTPSATTNNAETRSTPTEKRLDPNPTARPLTIRVRPKLMDAMRDKKKETFSKEAPSKRIGEDNQNIGKRRISETTNKNMPPKKRIRFPSSTTNGGGVLTLPTVQVSPQAQSQLSMVHRTSSVSHIRIQERVSKVLSSSSDPTSQIPSMSHSVSLQLSDLGIGRDSVIVSPLPTARDEDMTPPTLQNQNTFRVSITPPSLPSIVLSKRPTPPAKGTNSNRNSIVNLGIGGARNPLAPDKERLKNMKTEPEDLSESDGDNTDDEVPPPGTDEATLRAFMAANNSRNRKQLKNKSRSSYSSAKLRPRSEGTDADAMPVVNPTTTTTTTPVPPASPENVEQEQEVVGRCESPGSDVWSNLNPSVDYQSSSGGSKKKKDRSHDNGKSRPKKSTRK